MILLDTHALSWWALDPQQLSQNARDTAAEMEERGGFASSISIWELGVKVKRGKLELGISLTSHAAWKADQTSSYSRSTPRRGCAASTSPAATETDRSSTATRLP